MEWQLSVAAGEPLPLRQEDIALCGHAIEVSVYAEDPGKGFLPSTGRWTISACRPRAPRCASTTGVAEGDLVSPFYDPMLAKVVAYGENRPAALRQLRGALARSEIIGPATNLDFLLRIARDREFAAGAIDTGYIERNQESLLPPPEADQVWPDRSSSRACNARQADDSTRRCGPAGPRR